MRTGWVCMVLLALLVGCGSGGSGGSEAEKSPQIWEGTFNSAGFPDVEGDYAFRTGEISFTCGSDPSVGKFPGVAMTLKLSQFRDQLLAENDEADSDPSITIIDSEDSSALAGPIETDGQFILTQTVVYTIAEYEGQYTVNHELQGLFNASGWSGDYRYSTFNDVSETTCNFSSQFSGERLVVGPSAAAHAAPSAAENEPASTLLGHVQ